ncbi:putative phage abortive infection protein [Aliarcobacter cryaerophilus]|uniref:putative phage abortive infection protein n=1 Tax=Aliarcobacter cryaerophilus TaxID=28198 RepID=UPI0016543D60|nr:putative phage abortive infection protein [Aliarcobacter cryaerophilus]QNM92347.1 hypothetical protein HOO33_00430 [Aliarcobacter cryaerophilus]
MKYNGFNKLLLLIVTFVSLYAAFLLYIWFDNFDFIFSKEKPITPIAIEEQITIGKQIDKIEKFGQFGDYVGGTLNPLFAFFSFLILVFTIQLQRKQLNESAITQKKQLDFIEKQNFETTFFNMINLNNQIVNNLSLTKSNNSTNPILTVKEFYSIGGTNVNVVNDNNYTGKEVLSKLFEILNVFIKDNLKNNSYDPTNLYRAFLLEYQFLIDNYFRNIYNILKLIEQNKNIENKKTYSNILRAQLSNVELALILMNALYYHENKKLFYLLVKFEFMKPLNIVIISNEEDEQRIPFSKIFDKSYYSIVISHCLEQTSKMRLEKQHPEIKDFNNDTKIFGSNEYMKRYMDFIKSSSQEPQ